MALGGDGSPGLAAVLRALDPGGRQQVVLSGRSSRHADALFRTAFRAMASEHELLLGADDRRARARAADAAIADVARIEAKYSRYRDDSVVVARSTAPRAARPSPIDAETAALLRYADTCHARDDGRFDITSGVLRRAWDFERVPPRVPDAGESTRCSRWSTGPRSRGTSARCACRARAWRSTSAASARSTRPTASRRSRIDAGIAHGFVNLAGDVRASGGQPDGAPWRVGIRHPRVDGAPIGGIEIADGAVATSGDYERFVRRRRRALLPHPRRDDRDGRSTHWQSMSVAAPLCVVAGSGATIAMLLGADAPAWLDAQGVEWLGVDADRRRCGSAPGRRAEAGTRAVTAARRTRCPPGHQPIVVVNCW